MVLRLTKGIIKVDYVKGSYTGAALAHWNRRARGKKRRKKKKKEKKKKKKKKDLLKQCQIIRCITFIISITFVSLLFILRNSCFRTLSKNTFCLMIS